MVNLLSSPPSHPDLSAYDPLDFLMPDVEVVRGAEDRDPTNAFVCAYYDLDVLGSDLGLNSSEKIHVVGYEHVIARGSEKYMHHLLLASCGLEDLGAGALDGRAAFDDSDLYHGKVVPSCDNMPPGCLEFVAAWAVGVEAEQLPPDVGLPVGEGRRWMVLQAHYYNPSLDEGVRDSSGLRVHVAKNPRPIDAGRMRFVVGMFGGQHAPLPGGRDDVAMETLYVEPECTETWTEPIHVLSVGHHSHFLGTRQEIVVERAGVNLGPMRKEYAYDYNHQCSLEPMTGLQTLMPGDRLAATCHFNTSAISPDSVVEIGEESTKEMCLPTLLYYPKQKMGAFAYFQPSAAAKRYIDDYAWCSSAPTDGAFGSLCVEKLYTDVPAFFKQSFAAAGYNGPSLGLSMVCNGGALTAPIRNRLPICPEQCSGDVCSEEELMEQARSTCESTCAQFGLSLYPDVSRTELYETTNAFCPTRLFDEPTLAAPPACQVKGNLARDIPLVGIGGLGEEVNEGRTSAAEANGEGNSSRSPCGSVFVFISAFLVSSMIGL
ncbi:hypothetical protein ACHAWF_007524 [Thalassiosira exigua]